MSSEISVQPTPDKAFWKNATMYASACKKDERFVNEMAYMMVTLHRTGA